MGEQAPIHGKAQFQLGIGPLVLPQELWVADIQDQCILGLDFLYPNGCQVDLRDQLLTIGEHQIPLKRPSIITDQVCKAVLVQKVCLPPLAETIGPVRIEGPQLCTVGLLEQSTDPTHFDGLLVARTLVDTTRENISLRVLNLSHQQHTIRKGTQLASCNTVNFIVGTPSPAAKQISGQVQRTITLEEFPPHLEHLFA